ncbi:MAG: molybdopterin-dependent oxidoreductase [Acidobacteriaceae bacterium]|nr:molybdopterin-dependent oxidoreductase [Acidobacteriaceae bacterium]MBV9780242.1 molybdopterin-dependent oxidoreductase [Acidobacteriaceae bacterium]
MRPIFICLLLAFGQASSQVVVRVNDAKPVQLEVNTLAELSRQTAVLNDHGKQVNYEGVLLHDVLVRSGVDFSKGLHGKQLSSYVTAIGSDGYEVVYALADFDPSITNSAIILADRRDGKPLDANEGPLRIIVPQDKRPARSVRLLKEIDVVQLNK